MKKHIHTLFPLLVAGLLALSTFWLAYVVQRGRVDTGASKLRHDPDTIVKNFRVDRFDKTGLLQSQLNAQEMRHYPDNDTVELDEPQARFNDPQRQMIWTSERATGDNESQQITLYGNVRGVRPATADHLEQVLTTEELTILTDLEQVQTDKPVTFTQGHSRIDATGAQWDNLNGILQLQQVKSTLYEADKK